MLDFSKQEQKPLRELVYEELRLLIMTGKIKPGTRILELELAENMGVSRTPVREAIRKLEKENLVTLEPRKGTYVSDISAEDLENMLVVREPLEGLATYLATTRMTDEEIQAIKKISLEYEEALKNNDKEKMIDTDTHFHYLITKGSGNPYLIELCQELQDQVLRFRYMYFQSNKRAEDVIWEHKAILDSLEKRDADAARENLIRHIANLKESITNADDFKADTEPNR